MYPGSMWDGEIMILLLIYTVTGILYMFQSFLMASFAERLSLELRTKISRKLQGCLFLIMTGISRRSVKPCHQ